MEKNKVRYSHSIPDLNLDAPAIIVEYLVDIFHPASVVDVGCGLGRFLNIFLKAGVHDILGIDGSWVDKSKLFISTDYFREEDLEKKFSINRKFDLVLSLEVAEHLSEKAADNFIDNLTNLGNVIVFSAAITNQGGQNHINEQPINYWIEKFSKKGFIFYDVFRNRFWNNQNVDWWYRQNMFLVAHEKVDIKFYQFDKPDIKEINEYVHPALLAIHAQEKQNLEKKLEGILKGKAPGKFYLQLLQKKFRQRFFRFKPN